MLLPHVLYSRTWLPPSVIANVAAILTLTWYYLLNSTFLALRSTRLIQERKKQPPVILK